MSEARENRFRDIAELSGVGVGTAKTHQDGVQNKDSPCCDCSHFGNRHRVAGKFI